MPPTPTDSAKAHAGIPAWGAQTAGSSRQWTDVSRPTAGGQTHHRVSRMGAVRCAVRGAYPYSAVRRVWLSLEASSAGGGEAAAVVVFEAAAGAERLLLARPPPRPLPPRPVPAAGVAALAAVAPPAPPLPLLPPEELARLRGLPLVPPRACGLFFVAFFARASSSSSSLSSSLSSSSSDSSSSDSSSSFSSSSSSSPSLARSSSSDCIASASS
jgi:hypothetical protein